MTLPLPSPLSRTSDPISSHLAAAGVAAEKQESECSAILECLRASALPLTYREVWKRLQGRIAEPVEVMRRLDTLRKAKLIRSLAPIKRPCSVSGNPAQTWEAVR